MKPVNSHSQVFDRAAKPAATASSNYEIDLSQNQAHDYQQQDNSKLSEML